VALCHEIFSGYFSHENHFNFSFQIDHFWRPFVKRFALCYQTVVCPSVLSFPVCPVCNVGVLWPNGWIDQDETWHTVRPAQATLWQMRTQLPPKERGHSPQFSAYGCCGQTSGWIKMPLRTKVGLGPRNIVLDADCRPSSIPHGAQPLSQSSAHVWCCQMAGWIKMPDGTKVGLSPGHTVLHGNPMPQQKRGHSPPFSDYVYCGQTVAHLSYCWALVILDNISTIHVCIYTQKTSNIA